MCMEASFMRSLVRCTLPKPDRTPLLTLTRKIAERCSHAARQRRTVSLVRRAARVLAARRRVGGGRVFRRRSGGERRDAFVTSHGGQGGSAILYPRVPPRRSSASRHVELEAERAGRDPWAVPADRHHRAEPPGLRTPAAAGTVGAALCPGALGQSQQP